MGDAVLTLTVDAALEKVSKCTCPPSGKARKWYDAAKALADVVEAQRERERRETAETARLAEEEREAEEAADEKRRVRRFPRCPKDKKVGFPSRAAAKKRMGSIRSGDPLRPYFCTACGQWHLTSQKGRRDG